MSDAAVRPLVIVQPGRKLAALSHVSGDFADWMLARMAWPDAHCLRVEPQLGDDLPAPDTVGAVLVTGSAAMVTDGEDWMTDAAAWLRGLVGRGRPVLGVCFGHQLLAHALGGRVADNPEGIEVGTWETRLTDVGRADPLLGALAPSRQVQASHRQAVIELPPGAVRLSASARDPNHAYRVGARAWGVQFHPEFDAGVVRAYVDAYRDGLSAQGDDPEALKAAVRDTPEAAGVLARFADIVAAHLGERAPLRRGRQGVRSG